MPLHGWWSSGLNSEEGLKTDDESKDVQVVYLPALLPREAQTDGDSEEEDVPMPYSFDAFGRYICNFFILN